MKKPVLVIATVCLAIGLGIYAYHAASIDHEGTILAKIEHNKRHQEALEKCREFKSQDAWFKRFTEHNDSAESPCVNMPPEDNTKICENILSLEYLYGECR